MNSILIFNLGFGKNYFVKIRPIVALSGDDRLLESMQEFRIYGGEDHILDIGMTTSSESMEQNTDTRK